MICNMPNSPILPPFESFDLFALEKRVSSLVYQKKFLEALNHINQYPKPSIYTFKLCIHIQLLQKNFELALEHARIGFNLDPQNEVMKETYKIALENFTDHCFNARRYQDALPKLDILLDELTIDNPGWHWVRAFAHYHTHGISYLKQHFPKSENGLHFFKRYLKKEAAALLEDKEYEKVIELLTPFCVESHCQSTQIFEMRAKAFTALDQITSAKKDIEAALRISPADFRLINTRHELSRRE